MKQTLTTLAITVTGVAAVAAAAAVCVGLTSRPSVAAATAADSCTAPSIGVVGDTAIGRRGLQAPLLLHRDILSQQQQQQQQQHEPVALDEQLSNPYTISSQAQLVLALCSVLDVQRVLLVGHADGCLVTLAAAAAAAAAVAAAPLANSNDAGSSACGSLQQGLYAEEGAQMGQAAADGVADGSSSAVVESLREVSDSSSVDLSWMGSLAKDPSPQFIEHVARRSAAAAAAAAATTAATAATAAAAAAAAAKDGPGLQPLQQYKCSSNSSSNSITTTTTGGQLMHQPAAAGGSCSEQQAGLVQSSSSSASLLLLPPRQQPSLVRSSGVDGSSSSSSSSGRATATLPLPPSGGLKQQPLACTNHRP